MCKAYVRNFKDNGKPCTSIPLKKWECKHLTFEHYTFDGSVDDFEEKFNMVLVHPITGKLFFGYSFDFDFTDEDGNRQPDYVCPEHPSPYSKLSADVKEKVVLGVQKLLEDAKQEILQGEA